MIRRDINIKDEIKVYFFINPSARLRVREMERTLKLPLPSVIRYCKELENEEILVRLKTGNVVFYSSNRNSKRFLLEKRLFNIKQLHYSGLINYIITELSNPTIIVFGSYSRGEDVEKSDIDLYIESPSKKEIKLDKFERKLKRRIQVFKHKSIHEVRNKELADNIINGVTLNGFIEVLSLNE